MCSLHKASCRGSSLVLGVLPDLELSDEVQNRDQAADDGALLLLWGNVLGEESGEDWSEKEDQDQSEGLLLLIHFDA